MQVKQLEYFKLLQVVFMKYLKLLKTMSDFETAEID